MKKMHAIFGGLLLIVVIFFSEGITTLSEGVDTGIVTPIEVKAIIPENQIDKSKTYFDLLLNPGQMQELEVQLSNFTEEDRIVKVEANTATTNDNGIVDYSQHDKKKDPSLINAFSDISKTVNEVKIPKQSSVITKVTIQMPSKSYEGIIAGGIYIYDKEGSKTNYDGGSINNKFVYSLGVQLRNNVDLTRVEPKLVVDPKKIIPVHSDYLNGINIPIQNTSALFIKEVEVEARLIDHSNGEASHELKQTKLKIAPNSNFYLPFTWTDDEGTPLNPGDYQVNIKINSAEVKKKWTWTIPFKIEGKSAEEEENQLRIKDSDNKHAAVYITGLSIVILFIVLYAVLNRMNRKKK
ncbi:DUF916 and DUF3324 domain-containing protein [Enterococcus sp. AZ126]|uniref:DUF916 and DUF3324 domain-containing protein n=1 Tax=Enterococcus sp. AZ126 TaxID=2774635 RepID=UPI003F24F4EA